MLLQVPLEDPREAESIQDSSMNLRGGTDTGADGAGADGGIKEEVLPG